MNLFLCCFRAQKGLIKSEQAAQEEINTGKFYKLPLEVHALICTFIESFEMYPLRLVNHQFSYIDSYNIQLTLLLKNSLTSLNEQTPSSNFFEILNENLKKTCVDMYSEVNINCLNQLSQHICQFKNKDLHYDLIQSLADTIADKIKTLESAKKLFTPYQIAQKNLNILDKNGDTFSRIRDYWTNVWINIRTGDIEALSGPKDNLAKTAIFCNKNETSFNNLYSDGRIFRGKYPAREECEDWEEKLIENYHFRILDKGYTPFALKVLDYMQQELRRRDEKNPHGYDYEHHDFSSRFENGYPCSGYKPRRTNYGQIRLLDICGDTVRIVGDTRL